MKKQTLDNHSYTMITSLNSKDKCGYCGSRVSLYKRDIGWNGLYICEKCLSNKRKALEKKRKENALVVNQSDKIYLNSLGHDCNDALIEKYCTLTDHRRIKNNIIYFNMLYCEKCKKFFLAEKIYNTHKSYFEQYTIYNNHKANKKIELFKPIPITRRTETKKEIDMPSHIQWAAKHPYQGGGFSGK